MHMMTKISSILCSSILCAFTAFTAFAETASPTLTQRDLMINLVETLGYGYGLPDAPEDADYVKLLEGTRSDRYEAEMFRNPEDLVAINNFTSFGEFSGSGWVSAISAPTRMHMNFLLPHAGTYRLFARVRLPGHTFMLDGQTWKIPENYPQFQRVDLGEATLSAGMKELIVDMPPNGSIDYIELLAPPLVAITPLSAWDPSAPLTYTDLAVTTIRALGLQNLLPLQTEKIMIEAEESSPDKSFITDQRHLGEPHGGFWLRTNAVGGEIILPFNITEGAVYTFNLSAEGSMPLSGTVDTRDPWSMEFPPYLKEMTIGTWFLPPGQHELKIDLPSRGGVDLLTLLKRRSTAEDYRILAGLPAQENVDASDVNRLLTLLARLNKRD